MVPLNKSDFFTKLYMQDEKENLRSFIFIHDPPQDSHFLIIKNIHRSFHHTLCVNVFSLSERCFLKQLFPQVVKKRRFGLVQLSGQTSKVLRIYVFLYSYKVIK